MTMREAKLYINSDIVTGYIPQTTQYHNLQAVYDTCNELFGSHPECFYTPAKVRALKEDPANNFLKKSGAADG